MLAINILMVAMLFWVFYEDVKDKKVTLVLLISLFVVGGFLNSQYQIIELFLISSLINFGVILMVTMLLFIYTKVKLKTALFKVFGVGDLLFFAFMAVSFPTTTFLVLFSTSLIFSLILSLIFQKKLQKLIPLAGFQALFLGLIIGANQLLNIVNLYAF